MNSLDDPSLRWYLVPMTDPTDPLPDEVVDAHDYVAAFILSDSVEKGFHGGWADLAAIARWSGELGNPIPMGFLQRGQN